MADGAMLVAGVVLLLAGFWLFAWLKGRRAIGDAGPAPSLQRPVERRAAEVAIAARPEEALKKVSPEATARRPEPDYPPTAAPPRAEVEDRSDDAVAAPSEGERGLRIVSRPQAPEPPATETVASIARRASKYRDNPFVADVLKRYRETGSISAKQAAALYQIATEREAEELPVVSPALTRREIEVRIPRLDPEIEGEIADALRRRAIPEGANWPPHYRGHFLGVAGESFNNPNGTSRQQIIGKLKRATAVHLACEPDNQYDREAVMVLVPRGGTADQIGYLPRGHGMADEISKGRIAAWYASRRKSNGGSWGAVLYILHTSQQG